MSEPPAPAMVRLDWLTATPDALGRRLAGLGLLVLEQAFAVGPVAVAIVSAVGERLVERPAVSTADVGPSGLPVSAGWAVLAVAVATIDTERWIATAGGPGGGTGAVRPQALARDPDLGARATLLAAPPVSRVVLEPDTEGRLAAILARNGEGPAGLYLVRAVRGANGAPADRRDPRSDGPFGLQRLPPLGLPPWAPVVVRVDPAGSGRDAVSGTIAP